jgi:hypothetical protein
MNLSTPARQKGLKADVIVEWNELHPLDLDKVKEPMRRAHELSSSPLGAGTNSNCEGEPKPFLKGYRYQIATGGRQICKETQAVQGRKSGDKFQH